MVKTQVNRFILKELYDDLNSREVTILLGARQVGKTFLLRQVEQEAVRRGKKTAYFNLEIPSDMLQFKGSEETIYQKLIQTSEVILLDEFHYLKNASHLFKAVYDSGAKVKIFASGSSSLRMHKHLKESLAGRRHVIKIFPLCLGEFRENGLACDRILIDGTLPGLLHKEKDEDKQAYIRDIIETYILKDIKSLIKEENIRAFNHLLYLLAEHQGSVVSVSSLAREVGLTPRTVEKHLEILEQTYVGYSLPSYSTNQANELKKSRKYYFYDVGIRNALIKNFEYDLTSRSDRGVLYESAVFLELLRKVSANTSIHFWRTKQKEEVDFIKVTNRKPVPVEVKSGLRELEIPSGIRAFLTRYPQVSQAYVVTDGFSGKTKYKTTDIDFIDWKNTGTL